MISKSGAPRVTPHVSRSRSGPADHEARIVSHLLNERDGTFAGQGSLSSRLGAFGLPMRVTLVEREAVARCVLHAPGTRPGRRVRCPYEQWTIGATRQSMVNGPSGGTGLSTAQGVSRRVLEAWDGRRVATCRRPDLQSERSPRKGPKPHVERD